MIAETDEVQRLIRHPIPDQENDVTLQVALIGTDGIVLASDRRAVDSFHQIQTTSLTTKTIIRPDYKMAVAFSGNLKLSGAVAGKVIDSEFI
ncbi:MAG: hypothetical protein WCD04_11855, partial [Terriglobia bacterium]